MKNFDRELDHIEAGGRRFRIMFVLLAAWILFLMGAIGVGLWLLGFWLGAW